MIPLRHLEAQAQRAIVDHQLQQVAGVLSGEQWEQAEWHLTGRFLVKLGSQGATFFILLTTLLLAGFTLRAMMWLNVEYWVGLIGLVVILSGGLLLAIIWAGLFLPIDELWREVVVSSLDDKPVFSLNTLHHKAIRGQLYHALIYWGRINVLIRHQPDRQFQASQREITAWLWATYRLAYQGDRLYLTLAKSRQLHHLPSLIEQYERQLSQQIDPHHRQHIEQMLAHRRQQWATFQTLRDKQKQLHQQLDSTVAAWGAMYTQLLLVHHSEVTQESADHSLHKNISEQIAYLQDLTTAIAELQSPLLHN